MHTVRNSVIYKKKLKMVLLSEAWEFFPLSMFHHEKMDFMQVSLTHGLCVLLNNRFNNFPKV